MREHSGAEGKNNNHNPTLKDHEREKGVSGNAIHGEKKEENQPTHETTRTSP
jgi:hypothetical protein